MVIERILRDRDGLWRQIIDEQGLRQLTGQMLGTSAVSLAIYGAVLGANYGWLQALSSAVKLPLLFLATLAICLPTLYLFNLVFGARLSVLQTVTLIMVAVTVTSVLTLAFAPISLFFLISAHSYSFFKLLNVCILVLTAFVGLRFLTAGMRMLNDHQEHLAAVEAEARRAVAAPAEVKEPEKVLAAAAGDGATVDGTVAVAQHLPTAPPVRVQFPADRPRPVQPQPPAGQRPTSMTLLYIWILLFGFVGTQLGWTLRPFFGSPGEKFELFRNLDGTFYGDLVTTIGRLLSG
nr:hypothetical protein [Planosporangium mesophilum]